MPTFAPKEFHSLVFRNHKKTIPFSFVVALLLVSGQQVCVRDWDKQEKDSQLYFLTSFPLQQALADELGHGHLNHHLRGLLFNDRGHPIMRQPCTLHLKHIMYEERTPDLVWDCELDREDANGIEGTFASIEGLELLPNSRDNDGNPLVSGESTLFANGIELIRGEAKARFPNGATPYFGRRSRGHRHLATVTGNKPVLAVRVIGADSSTTANMTEISDSIFGTNGDPVNLKSQFASCSFNKLNITPAPNPGFPGMYCGRLTFLDFILLLRIIVC